MDMTAVTILYLKYCLHRNIYTSRFVHFVLIIQLCPIFLLKNSIEMFINIEEYLQVLNSCLVSLKKKNMWVFIHDFKLIKSKQCDRAHLTFKKRQVMLRNWRCARINRHVLKKSFLTWLNWIFRRELHQALSHR